VHQVGFIYKITQKGHFVTFPYKDLYVLSANRFQTWTSVCGLNFSSEIAFVKSPKSERDGMELLT